ncbi:AP-4 complex subunit epsilon [Acorus calamus]|uniref:AP-4 complex subunit epsilon n=1 Tax=Acorus calamus TaxID=4465 RepID=A0AAV9F5K1_ACOCL|nr:AP-4 complex subunit epsilon [Acorus calamus]
MNYLHLIQRAYELQALLGLDAHAVENIMPSDASCEDIEVDKSLSFLNSFVQQSLEKGAIPYIPENERSGIVDTSNFRHHDHQDSSSHALRFEAYELPKPPPPPVLSAPISFSPSTELVPVPESTYPKEAHRASPHPPVPETLSADGGVRLRLEGVQKKWGRPTYSSPATSTSASTSQKSANGVTHADGLGNISSQRKDATFGSSKQKVKVSEEKQRLAASLFGSSSSKSERRPSSNQRISEGSTASSDKPPAVEETVVIEPSIKKSPPPQPPPDLLDLGEPATGTIVSLDPFKELEGFLGPTQDSSSVPSDSVGATKPPDLMTLYTDTPLTGLGGNVNNDPLVDLYTTSRNSHGGAVAKKGLNLQDSLEKDALARQVGVTPSGRNFNLFRDLLG